MIDINWMEKANYAGVKGFLHPVELNRLVELAEGRDVLEVGSFMGLSAWGMAHTAKSVHCCDTFSAWTNGQTQSEELTTLEDFKRSASFHSNITYFVGTSEAYAEACPKKLLYDMVFLDAMHTYEDVKADIQRWLPRLRVGGIFAMHDYRHGDYPGVERAADEVFGPAPEGTTEVTLRWVVKE